MVLEKGDLLTFSYCVGRSPINLIFFHRTEMKEEEKKEEKRDEEEEPSLPSSLSSAVVQGKFKMFNF